MEHKKRRLKVFIIAGIILMLALVLALFVPGIKSGKDAENQSNSTQETVQQTETDEEGSAEEETVSADPLAVLFCTSDYQKEEGWGEPADNLSAILHAVSAAGKKPSGVLISGDYTNDRNLHDHQLSPEDSIAELKTIIHSDLPDVLSDDAVLFEQGNHDALTESISKSGLHEYDSYLVYVLNTENDFPWKQGKVSGCLKKVKASSKAMDECFADLAEKGEKRPVIILGHVPLHFTARTSSRHTTGDNLYSSLIFNTINKYGNSINIIYLFGHNHSKGWDCYLGGSSVYRAAGTRLLVPEFDESQITSDRYISKTLNFTYLNAGYTGYYMNCGPAELDAGSRSEYENDSDSTLTGTVIEIYEDRIEISRWDAEGMHDLGAAGDSDPYKDGIDEGLIPSTEYSTPVPSPQTITRY